MGAARFDDPTIEFRELGRSARAAAKEAQEEEEEDDEEQQIGKRKRVTAKVLKGLIKEQNLYRTPCLNDKLYLHYGGYDRIEGLDEWTGLRALWLEGNGFDKIQGLNKLTQLRCLYLQQNCIKSISGLECCPLIASLNVANNYITTIDGLSSLRHLGTLQIANNHLTTADDLLHLLEVPTLNVLDLQNNRLDEPEVLDVLEAMPVLAVLQLQGNAFVPKVSQYRRNTISRCRALSYLDDRPVFEEERLAVDAWAVGGLPAEREERRRQREEKDAAHKRNLEYMMSFSGKKHVKVEAEDEEDEKPKLSASEFAKQQEAKLAEEKMTEKQMYERALGAVERKRAELMRLKAERQKALGMPEEEESKEGAAAAGGTAGGEAAAEASTADEGRAGGARFAGQSAEDIVSELEGTVPGMQVSEPAEPPPASFEPATAFSGPRAGKVFKSGEYGLGYYADAAALAAALAAPADAAAGPTPPPPAPPSAEEDDLDELD